MDTQTKLTDAQKAAVVLDYKRQANGFDNHYSTPLHRFTYSSGVKLVADTCGAHWLIDAIGSYQIMGKVWKQPFQAWMLCQVPADGSWLLRCEDGNGNHVVSQAIEYSDFPKELSPFEKPFSVWLENNVLFLPEER